MQLNTKINKKNTKLKNVCCYAQTLTQLTNKMYELQFFNFVFFLFIFVCCYAQTLTQ